MKKFMNFIIEQKKNSFLETIEGILYERTEVEMILEYLGEDFEKLKIQDYDTDVISFICVYSDIENIMDIELGIFAHYKSFDQYGYYVDIDESEKEYIFKYFNDNSVKTIKEIADLFDYKLILNDNEVYQFLVEYELTDVLDDFVSSLSILYTTTLKNKIKKEISDIIPFEFETFGSDYFYSQKTPKGIKIDYDHLIKYIKNNSDTKFNNLSQIFNHMGATLPYSSDISTEIYEEIKDFSMVKNEIVDAFNMVYKYGELSDYYWRNILDKDNIKLFKKIYHLFDWSSTIGIGGGGTIRYSYFHAIDSETLKPDSRIYEYIWSDEFLKIVKPLYDNDNIFKQIEAQSKKIKRDKMKKKYKI